MVTNNAVVVVVQVANVTTTTTLLWTKNRAMFTVILSTLLVKRYLIQYVVSCVGVCAVRVRLGGVVHVAV